MNMSNDAKIAIVDYGLGNLFSVKLACAYAGLQATITSEKRDIFNADAILLPGIGAFGDAMEALAKLDLPAVLKNFASSSKPIVGICLGMQLLMSESYEFGYYKGLGIINGSVEKIQLSTDGQHRLKVPHIGWNSIKQERSWQDSLLDGISNNNYMYFVHSYVVRPEDQGVILSTTLYGDDEFCSSLSVNNIQAFQFHPERSGLTGLKIYTNLAEKLKKE